MEWGRKSHKAQGLFLLASNNIRESKNIEPICRPMESISGLQVRNLSQYGNGLQGCQMDKSELSGEEIAMKEAKINKIIRTKTAVAPGSENLIPKTQSDHSLVYS